MKYTIYEHPVTHKFAITKVPPKFADGDKLPIEPNAQWFNTREEAVATLPELLNRDD